jgi:hypothetical protein
VTEGPEWDQVGDVIDRDAVLQKQRDEVVAELSFGYSGHEVGLSAFVEQAGELEFA